MLYNELIAEVTRRVEAMPRALTNQYSMSFNEALSMFLEDFEHDILLSRGSNDVLSEEFLANAAFDKMLDEELTTEATKPVRKPCVSDTFYYKCTWVD